MIENLITAVGRHPVMTKPGFRHAKQLGRLVRERYGTATADQRVLPDLVIAGAQRCGTTALTEALYRLPVVERPRLGKGSHYFSYNHHRGWDWFRGQFPTEAQAERVRADHGRSLFVYDACPYYLFHPFAIERLAAELPDAKVLVMLRDPVRRAESHYHHSVAHGHETLTLPEALDAEAGRLAGEVDKMAADPAYWSLAHEHHSYVSKGQYAEQVEHLWAHVPREQTMVVEAEAFYRDPTAELAAITDWLELPAVSLVERDNRNSHAYDPMSSATRSRLEGAFADSNERLFEMLGRRLDWTGPGDRR